MKKRELQAIIEAQAAEIADLRRRVEELEARPVVDTITAPEVEGGSLTIGPNDGWTYWPLMWHGITPPPRWYC